MTEILEYVEITEIERVQQQIDHNENLIQTYCQQETIDAFNVLTEAEHHQ